MSRRGPAGTSLAVALLVVLLAAAAAPSAGDRAGPSAVPAVGQVEPDAVLLDVSLQPDGDASWAVRYRVRLDDDNKSAAFDSLEQDIDENGSAYTSRFADRMASTVRAAENATGRDMAVRNVSVRTTRQEIPQRYGVLVYEFEWTRFAVADGSTIEAGDAIAGLFLDESTSLTVQWPAGYGVDSADPPPDDAGDRSATWRGPQDFTTDQPRIVLSTEAAAGDGGDGSGDGGSGPSDGNGEPGEGGDGPGADGESGSLPITPLALVGLGALLAVGAGLWWRGRRPEETDPTAATAEEEPPEELLSNEERVVRLIERNGGRMKQQQVVEELGWTDAKTSQVVGDLRESGAIEAFRLGRENVLDLASEDDDEPTP